MSKSKNSGSTRLIAVTGLAVLVASIGGYVAWWHWHVTHWGPYYGNAGAFGDAFSPVTGLLSTLALAAAVVSVLLQKRELELQREELAETREVFREQQEAQAQLALEQRKANVIAEERARLQAIANQVAHHQYEFDRIRLRWERRVEGLRNHREALQAEATLVTAVEHHRSRRGSTIEDAFTNLDAVRKRVHDVLVAGNEFLDGDDEVV